MQVLGKKIIGTQKHIQIAIQHAGALRRFHQDFIAEAIDDEEIGKGYRYGVEGKRLPKYKEIVEIKKFLPVSHSIAYTEAKKWIGGEGRNFGGKYGVSHTLAVCLINFDAAVTIGSYLDSELTSILSRPFFRDKKNMTQKAFSNAIKSKVGSVLHIDSFDPYFVTTKSRAIDEVADLVAELFLYTEPKNSGSNQMTSNYAEGIRFEEEVQNMLKYSGYSSKLTKRSGDFGADLVLDVEGLSVAMQVKSSRIPVGIKAVQEAVASMPVYECDLSVVVSKAGYTAAAVTLARANNVLILSQEQLPLLATIIEAHFNSK